ncbi:hypothetical protein [Salipiger mucosus]|uniref:Uncharacterized protein n=1 Tax=Salipiger mucosus DSM 16094 TaxID=1123237 RepID=S9RF46_9RHOB|nr:hypothetical protein [Salipiger mucosus]EPX76735.1 hypothetical protein Salmuc_05275 [Salipiger mucosus DSM 16094]
MAKVIAILNVVAWAGFWAFGYLALTADAGRPGQMVTALLLAAVGAALGLWAYLWLVGHSERSGYAEAPKRAYPDEELRDNEGAL